MKPEQLNEWFDSITPAGHQKAKMLDHILSTGSFNSSMRPARQNRAKMLRMASIIVLIVLLLAGGSLIRYFSGETPFTMIAYAGGIEDPAVASGQIVEISEHSSIELPFGKIERYGGPIETKDDSGNEVIRYNANFTDLNNGNGTFSIQGEEILSVTYTSEKGLMSYTDEVMMEQDPGYIKAQQTAAEKNQKLVVIPADAPYEQSGQKITPKYYPELGDRSFAVDWAPFYATEMLSKDGDISPADLPHDRITIEVTLKNKQQVVKVMDLSFAADGHVIARMLK